MYSMYDSSISTFSLIGDSAGSLDGSHGVAAAAELVAQAPSACAGGAACAHGALLLEVRQRLEEACSHHDELLALLETTEGRAICNAAQEGQVRGGGRRGRGACKSRGPCMAGV